MYIYFTTEVEKLLKDGETSVPWGTPHAYKKTHSGSTGNIHGLVGLSEQSATGRTANGIVNYVKIF